MYNIILIVLLYLFNIVYFLDARLLEGLYCGNKNCYDVLGVTRDTETVDIRKAYRRLAIQYHPDKHRDPEVKVEFQEQFKAIATAYEILRNDEARTDYDYMLDHPEEYYAHYYRYYSRRVAPKVDVRIVVVVTISVISIIQYYSARQRYETAIKYFMSVQKYRNRAIEIAQQQGMMQNNKKTRGKSKAEQKEEQELIIRMVIEEKMDIKGAYAKPTLYDVLWVQLIMLPYTVTLYLYWYVSWIWNHTILKRPYNKEEKLYIIRKYLKMGQHQFNSIEDDEKEGYLEQKLWIKDNFTKWHQEKEENLKKKLAESSRYKQYQRYMKNHGIGRMTFEE